MYLEDYWWKLGIGSERRAVGEWLLFSLDDVPDGKPIIFELFFRNDKIVTGAIMGIDESAEIALYFEDRPPEAIPYKNTVREAVKAACEMCNIDFSKPWAGHES
jgi:hypothetical protein